MSVQRRDWLGGAGATVLGGCLGLVGVGARAAVQWKLATGYKPETFYTQNAELFAQDVGKASGGELAIAVHSNNSLVKLPEIFGAVQSGKAEAGEVLMAGIVKDVPLAGADSVPFVLSTYKDARRLWQYQAPLIETALAAKGLVPLYAVAWPPQGLFSVKPVRTKSDFQGLKMRTYNATTVRIAELLGATPVDVATADIPKALASGQIEAMITSSATGAESQVWTHAKFYYELNAWIPKNMVFASKKAMDALSPAARKGLLDSAKVAEDRGWTMSEAALRNAVGDLKSHGMAVERLSLDLGREIGRLGERFSREWVRTVGNDATRLFIPFYTQAS
ncbi:TRAP transporter substrate-binding protein [Acidovorax sp. LjRoot118]|uniref:TRAP transporter substrate-binding protein n=1 Tax=Acidovorax sp. LjRoot118 TaxID=3342256 RepID=UPI003ECEEC26